MYSNAVMSASRTYFPFIFLAFFWTRKFRKMAILAFWVPPPVGKPVRLGPNPHWGNGVTPLVYFAPSLMKVMPRGLNAFLPSRVAFQTNRKVFGSGYRSYFFHQSHFLFVGFCIVVVYSRGTWVYFGLHSSHGQKFCIKAESTFSLQKVYFFILVS